MDDLISHSPTPPKKSNIDEMIPSPQFTDSLQFSKLEGNIGQDESAMTLDMGSPGPSRGGIPSTLDEPVKDTIMRDVRAIGQKFGHVFFPKKSQALLRDWDLWGPLILCVALATLLHTSTADNNDAGGPEFAEIFVIFWLGSMLVTLNIKLLGGSLSVFQAICVLGYCVLPLLISLVLCQLVLFATQTTFLFLIRLILVIAGIAWSIFASTAFLADCQPRNKTILAVYPLCLFYVIIGWLIISH